MDSVLSAREAKQTGERIFKHLLLAFAVCTLFTTTSAFSQSTAQRKSSPETASTPDDRAADVRSATGGQTTGPDWKSKGVVGPFGLGMVGTLAVVAGVIVLIAAATDGGDSNSAAQH